MTHNRPKNSRILRRRTLLSTGVALALSTAFSAEIQSKEPDSSRFVNPRQIDGVVLSPNGQRLVMLGTETHERVEMPVQDLATLTPVVVADGQKVVRVNDRRLAFTLADLDELDGKEGPVTSGPRVVLRTAR